MATEMAAQPQVAAGLIARRSRIMEALTAVLPERPVGLTLVARGTSMNAAVYGRYVLELAARRPVAVVAPSIVTVYGAEVDYRGWVAVATSQSGRTPEIITLISRLRRQGAVAVGITNDPYSPLAEAVDVVMDLGAGEERAVPATKTFTATAIAFALLSELWGPALSMTAWQTLPTAIRSVVDDLGPAEAATDLIERAGEILCIGRGLAFPMALETALKVRETAGANAAAYSSADVRHGPLAAADHQDVALLFATDGAAGLNTLQLQDVLHARGVRQLVIGEVEGAGLWTPAGLPEPLAVIPMAVRGQQLALLLAERRGLDPDRPHGLSKVTMT